MHRTAKKRTGATASSAIGIVAAGRSAAGRSAVGRSAIGRSPIGKSAIGRSPIGKSPIGRSAIACTATALAAIAIAGCGGGSSKPASTHADPATVVPATASAYVRATVRPEGALAADSRADAKTLTGSKEPFGALVSALAAAAQLPHLHYGSEVKPWLGAGAGLFVVSPVGLEGLAGQLGSALGSEPSAQSLLESIQKALASRSHSDYALILDVSETSAANGFLEKLATRTNAQSGSFHGVSYHVDSTGLAFGDVGHFVVIGSEEGLHGTIETDKGGSSLSSTTPYATLTSKAKPSSSLLSAYVNTEAVASAEGAGSEERSGSEESATSEEGAEAGSGSQEATEASSAASTASHRAAGPLAVLPGEPCQLLLSVIPQHRQLSANLDLLASSPAAASVAAKSTAEANAIVGELPASSWLALGAGEVGAHLPQYLRLLQGVVGIAGKSLLAGLGGPALEGLVGHLAAEPQALRQIFGRSTRAAGVFAAGTGLLNLQAGLVIDMSSPASALAAVSKLGQALRAAGAGATHASIPGASAAIAVRVTGLPLVLDIGAGGERVVLGLGPASVQAALSPEGGTLSSSAFYEKGKEALGGLPPAVILDFPTLLSLLEGLSLTESPSLSGVLPTLRSLGTLDGGWQQLGGSVTRLHLALGLPG